MKKKKNATIIMPRTYHCPSERPSSRGRSNQRQFLVHPDLLDSPYLSDSVRPNSAKVNSGDESVRIKRPFNNRTVGRSISPLPSTVGLLCHPASPCGLRGLLKSPVRQSSYSPQGNSEFGSLVLLPSEVDARTREWKILESKITGKQLHKTETDGLKIKDCDVLNDDDVSTVTSDCAVSLDDESILERIERLNITSSIMYTPSEVQVSIASSEYLPLPTPPKKHVSRSQSGRTLKLPPVVNARCNVTGNTLGSPLGRIGR